MRTYRRTWVKWRERNRTGRYYYEARMDAADQCPVWCTTCGVQCDMGDGHYYSHQFAGKCAGLMQALWDLPPGMTVNLRDVELP